MQDVLGLVGAITGALGLFVALSDHFRQARYEAVNQFLTELGEKELIEARKHIYNTDPVLISIDDEKASLVVNFYHKWGMMAEHRLLPLWVFNEANRNGMMRLYDALSRFMASNREKNGNDDYASGFEYLHRKLEQKKPSR